MTFGCIRVISALAILNIMVEILFARFTSSCWYQASDGSVLFIIVIASILYIPLLKSWLATTIVDDSEASRPVTSSV